MKGFFLITAILCFGGICYGQSGVDKGLPQVLQKLEKYQNDYPQEKVYLHLDKPYYAVGDTIWFKGYVTVGQLNFLSGLSKILNVDLIGPDNTIVRSLRLPVVSGLTMGDIKLADSLSEGNYRIRAYTNWMRNFDTDFYFDKVIPVGNTLTDNLVTHSEFSYQDSQEKQEVQAKILLTDIGKRPIANSLVNYEVELDARNVARGKERTDANGLLSIHFTNKQVFNLKAGRIRLNIQVGDAQIVHKIIPITHTSKEYVIQFYPESGILLAGSMNKLGFKVLGPDGKGANASGIIVDDSGTKLMDFSTDYAGMGNLVLLPEAGKTYHATVRLPDSTQKEIALPKVETSGYILSVNNVLEKNVYLQVSSAEAKGQTMSVIAQKNGQVFYAAKLKQLKAEVGMSISRDKLPSGVIQLTLFDEQMKPVAERLIFNLNADDRLKLEVMPDKQAYQPKEKVSIKLSAGTSADSLRIGSFSVAITDAGKVPVEEDKDQGIVSTLLLSEELKGYIEDPGHYFNHINEETVRQLDNLMLTQGWRRIVWAPLLAGTINPVTYKPEQAMRISGTIVKHNGKPVPNAKVTVLSTSNFGAVIDTVTDADGRFNFDRLIFYDSTKFVVQARDEKGKKNVEILMDEVPRQQIGQDKNSPDLSVDVNQSISTYLKSTSEQFAELQKYGLMERSYLLQEVTVTAKPEPKVKNSSNLNGPGNADQVLTADDLSTCPTLDMCLQGRLMGVIFRNGVPYSTRSQNIPMLVVLDGMYMDAESNPLSMISPSDVQTIEVLRNVGNTAIYGSMGGGGVLVITTKTGNGGSARDRFVPGIVTYSPQGYYAVHKFTAPDYSKPQEKEGMVDLRTTILWKPDVVTDAQGNASFEFYTASTPGKYRIVVEGIDANGHLARSVSYLLVK
ncbi:TonB-dependent Receptor Plug Domain [bacterium A37T11]|nr:TonB-dependent Receptor Plug Domain [bacterium A37T11]